MLYKANVLTLLSKTLWVSNYIKNSNPGIFMGIQIPVQWVQGVVIGRKGEGRGMGKRRKKWKECISYGVVESNFSSPKHITHNLSTPLKTAIRNLEGLPDTVIKLADKGGAIGLWPTTKYLHEAHKQLHNTNYYRKVQHNPIPSLVRDITQFLNHNGHTDYTIYKFLLPHSPPRSPLFYLLPKLRKPNIPGRPIISGSDCPTDNLSKYIEHHLKPLIPSYIKDTTHFLNTILQIPAPLPHNTVLVKIDITSLYTNIPNNEGIDTNQGTLHTTTLHGTTTTLAML